MYILLIVTAIGNAVQSLISKEYSTKEKNVNTYLYSAMVAFSAMLFFVITSVRNLHFDTEFIPYSIGFALAYSMATIGSIKAINYDSLSISSMIHQCALIIPTLYGLVILNEKIGVFGYAGIILIFLCIFLVTPKVNDKKTEKSEISLLWILWVAVGFAGNGFCSVIQKMEQLRFEGAYKNEFMIIALAISTLVMLTASVTEEKNRCRKSTKDKEKNEFSTAFGTKALAAAKYAPFQGIANGLVNLLVMVLTTSVSTAILFPVVIAGGMTITLGASVVIFKEKLTAVQLIGYIFGMTALVLLNI